MAMILFSFSFFFIFSKLLKRNNSGIRRIGGGGRERGEGGGAIRADLFKHSTTIKLYNINEIN